MRASTSVVSAPGHQTLHSGNSPSPTRLPSASYMPTGRTATLSVATYAWPLPGAISVNHRDRRDRNLYCLWAACR